MTQDLFNLRRKKIIVVIWVILKLGTSFSLSVNALTSAFWIGTQSQVGNGAICARQKYGGHQQDKQPKAIHACTLHEVFH